MLWLSDRSYVFSSKLTFYCFQEGAEPFPETSPPASYDRRSEVAPLEGEGQKTLDGKGAPFGFQPLE